MFAINAQHNTEVNTLAPRGDVLFTLRQPGHQVMLPCICSNIGNVILDCTLFFVHAGLFDALYTVCTVRAQLLEVYTEQASVSARLFTMLTAW